MRLRGDVAVDHAPVAGSSGIWPETNSREPARIAWEYGPIAGGADGGRDRLPHGAQAALTTLLERRQRVQTRRRRMPPLTSARTL